MKTISQIAREHNVKLVQITLGDQYCRASGNEYYKNRSLIVSGDIPIIYLGIYTNEELKNVSFFHELGHVTKHPEGLLSTEEEAWKQGFVLAKEYGYVFSESTYVWCFNQLSSYGKKYSCELPLP